MGVSSTNYRNGCIFFEKGKYENAMNCFEVAAQSFKYRDNAIEKIIRLHLATGNYEKARDLLELNYQSSELDLNNLYGLLEMDEFNYKASLKYFQRYLQNPGYKNKARFHIGVGLQELGEYELAEKVFASLNNDEELKYLLLLQKVYMSIMQEDYEKAYFYLTKINIKTLKSSYRSVLMNLKCFLDVKLGKVNLDNAPKNVYSYQRLLNPQDKQILLKHIKEHQNPKTCNGAFCFKENVDLAKLVDQASREIQNSNPVHYKESDIYHFSLDYPVAYRKEQTTNDLAVVTPLNSSIITTIYPVKLSSSFNQEGYAESEELALKRKLK